MTPISNRTFIKKVKDITISGTIALSILGGSLQSCGSNNSDDDEYSYEEVYTKGVKTYISETSKGVFKITDEKEVPIDSSVAIVSYLDGKKDSLSPKVVQGLIDSEVKSSPNTIGESSNLSNALLFGGMGYLLAKTVSPTYANYRPDISGVSQKTNASTKADTARHRRRNHFGGGMGMMAYYATTNAFNRSSQIHQNIGNSRTTMARPTGGRSGFFHSSSHSSHSS